MNSLSIWKDLRPFSVGFDNIFDHFNNHLEHTLKQGVSYPPYNIAKVDDLKYQIEMALAGFSKKDIEVTYADNQLTIKSIDQGHGTGFCMGNILKYAQRYGKKDGHNKNDLLKVIHYAIIQLSQDHYKENI
jgi:hypothetical protein